MTLLRTRYPAHFALLIGLLVASLLLVACGDNPTLTPVNPTPTPGAKSNPNSSTNGTPGKIALVMVGSVSDGGWYSLALEAAIKLRKDFGVTVDYAENMSTPEKEVAALRDFASKGYGLIIMPGPAAPGESVKKVAPDFPNTWFVELDGLVTTPNSLNLTLKYEEIGYLSGLAAAYATKSNKFGGIFGPHSEVEDRYALSVEQGLKAVNPNAEFRKVNLDWEDGPGASAAAKDMFDKGVDLIIYDLNPANQPVLEVAQQRHKLVINPDYDLHSVAPDTVLTSMLYSMPSAYKYIAKLWLDKKLESKTYRLGLKEEALALAPLRGKISKEEEAQIEKAKADIIAGNLKVGGNVTP